MTPRSTTRRSGLAAGLVLAAALDLAAARSRVDLEGPAGYVAVLLVLSLSAALNGLANRRLHPRAEHLMATWGVVTSAILLVLLAAIVVAG